MPDCVVQFLRGNTVTIKECAKALDVRVKIAAMFDTLYPHIVVLDVVNAHILDDDFSFLPPQKSCSSTCSPKNNDGSKHYILAMDNASAQTATLPEVHVTAIINEPINTPLDAFSVGEWRHIMQTHAEIDDVAALLRAIDGPRNTSPDPERREGMLWLMQQVLFEELRGENGLGHQASLARLVATLVNARVDVNTRDKRGCTPLIYAVHASVHMTLTKSDPVLVQAPLTSAADSDVGDIVGRPSLMHMFLPEGAARKDVGREERMDTTRVMRVLLEAKANVNRSTKYGWNALLCAVENNQRQSVAMLIEYDADVNQDGPCGWTPLHFAAREGHSEIVDLLLLHDANVNRRSYDQSTAIIFACANGFAKIVDTLLRHRADANVENNDGSTPLRLAAENGHEAVVKLLLEHEVSAKHASHDRMTIMTCATEHKRETTLHMLRA
eukprot:GEMP01011438.1.p1 GENE.GEMP01011438.1~~GEMP01011438.1.p1  ORF type:complete len:441 (+),score=118.68 GEMP01011438.1:201-1523(+)